MHFPCSLELSLPNIEEGENTHRCGVFEVYDKTYATLRSMTVGNVYASDATLATIMCNPRSNYSSNIVIEQIGGKFVMDNRRTARPGQIVLDSR